MMLNDKQNFFWLNIFFFNLRVKTKNAQEEVNVKETENYASG